MKGFIILLMVFSSLSCSTIKTLDPPMNHVQISYKGNKSYCEKIPRIYSGISYNGCLIIGEANSTNNIDYLNGVPLIFIDSALSIFADTVVLPYTIYSQSKKGNIQVN